MDSNKGQQKIGGRYKRMKKNWTNESGARNEKEQNKWISKQERNIRNESTIKGNKGKAKKTTTHIRKTKRK